jgi:hypothetical protein
LAAATAQGYKASQQVGALTYSGIDSQSPLNPPDFTAYTLSPNDTVRPLYYQYNAGIDQAINWRFLRSHLSVAYVGSHNVNLGSYNGSTYNSASDLNVMCGIEKGCAPNLNPFNPSDNLFLVNIQNVPEAMSNVSGVNNGLDWTTPEYDNFRPYPFFHNIYQLKHDFYSNYNSAQVVWNKVTGMVTYGANYTFAKNLATASSFSNIIPDPVNLRNDYNPVSYDRTQVFNIHYLVDLGKRYKGGGWILPVAANGWQVSGVSSVDSGFPLASVTGENFGFYGGSVQPVQTEYQIQSSGGTDSTCETQYGIKPDQNGHTYCVQNMDGVTWLGTPDVQLMPTVLGNIKGGTAKHQFINPLGFGLPLPETNGQFRLPYIHGPYYMDHDVTVLKNFSMGEKKRLQLRFAAFNVFNHPLVSFNNENTNNLRLAFQTGTVGQALTNSALTYKDFGVADIKVGNRLVEVGGKFSF